MKPGDKVKVFDPRLWAGKDVGDNSQFWKEATVLSVRWVSGCLMADVKFDHDGRTSRSHFTHCIKPL